MLWRVLWAPSAACRMPHAQAHVQNMLFALILCETQSRHLYSAYNFFSILYMFIFAEQLAEDTLMPSGTSLCFW